MPKFGKRSRKNLESCDPRLQDIFNEVIKHVDCSVIEGHRSKERQNKLYDEGKTQVKHPNGRHNAFPLFAGFVKGIALAKFNIKLRWGGDWDSDFQVQDNRFDDFPHFELKEVE